MNLFEITSSVRLILDVPSESDLRTPVLWRAVNLAYQNVGALLLPLYRKFMIKTVTLSDQTGTSVSVPGDLLKTLEVLREYEENADRMIPCNPVPDEDKGQLGLNPNYGNDKYAPVMLDEGKTITIYPEMSAHRVDIRYRKRLVDLVAGKITRQSETTATMPATAEPEDDVYNDHYLAVYEVTAGDQYSLVGTYKVADYAGSTKLITVSGSSLQEGNSYFGALVPIIPSEFHFLLLDAAVIMAKRFIRKDYDWALEWAPLREQVQFIIEQNGAL